MSEFVLPIVMLAGSLVIMAFSSNLAVTSMEKIIEFTGLSEAAAGIAILAVMTSAPEMTVALFSVLQGAPGIAIGDILGSNLFNLGAIMGMLAILGFLKTCCPDTVMVTQLTDILFLTALIPILLVIFEIATPIVGIILFGVFILNVFTMTKKRTIIPVARIEEKPSSPRAGRLSRIVKESKIGVVAILILSLAGLMIAGNLVVSSAVGIATLLGAPQILVGAKIVSLGTSLPELTLDITAVRRGHVQMALGDIVGSNLMNLTFVLGLVLITSPFTVDITIFSEILPFLLITTIIFWRFLMRGEISKIGGILLLGSYIMFLIII
ncbi:MAG: sodium:calcium antiporter [Candidatus Hodarchaeota archaeon]